MQLIQGPEEIERLKDEARQIYYAAPVIFPLLERKRNDAYGRLLGTFRQGRTDNLTIVAELSVISAIESELKTKLQIFEAQEKK